MPDLLPLNATIQERAISLSVDRLPTVPIKTLWTPAACPEAQLPWLAWALSVDEWDAAWPVETKREVIATSIEQHRKKGTVGALRRALQRLGYEVEIDEATGVAYTFKIRVRIRAGESAGGSVSEDILNRSIAIALRHKNARSFLSDTLYVADTDAAGLFVGGVTMSGLEYESKQTPAFITAPYGSEIQQTGDFTFSATWVGDGEYYIVEAYVLDNPNPPYNYLISNMISYSPSISDVYIPENMHGNLEFNFRVRSVKSNGISAWDEKLFTLIVLPPSNLSSISEAPSQVTIYWQSSSHYSDFEICASGDNFNTIIQSGTTNIGPWGSQSHTIQPLFAGLYDVRLRAIDTQGIRSEWAELSGVLVN
jgi:phage tail P2-like protein